MAKVELSPTILLNKSLGILLTMGLILGLMILWGRQYYTLSAVTALGVFDGSYYSVRALMVDVPDWFKFLLYIQFFTIFLIVLVVFMCRMHRKLPIIYTLSYLGMWIYSAFLLIFFSQDPIPYISSLSPMLSKMAPGTIMAIGLFFLAANDKFWPSVQKTLIIIIFLSLLLTIYGIINMEHVSRWHAQRWVWAPGIVLELLCVLPIAVFQHKSLFMRLMSYVPIIMLPVSGLLQQTRLVFVMLIIQILFYNFIRLRSTISKKMMMIKFCSSIFIITILVTFLSFFSNDLYSVIGKTTIGKSSHSFIDRLTDKGRLKQIEPFFEIFWDKFPLGAGYPAKGEVNGESDMRNGIDSGYLNTTYVCGIPMLICFITMMVIPVVRSLVLRLDPVDAAIATGAFAYCIRLTSSSVPNFQIDFIIFVLLAGRCAYLVSNKNEINGLHGITSFSDQKY